MGIKVGSKLLEERTDRGALVLGTPKSPPDSHVLAEGERHPRDEMLGNRKSDILSLLCAFLVLELPCNGWSLWTSLVPVLVMLSKAVTPGFTLATT